MKNSLFEELQDPGNLEKDLEILELITLHFLLGSEDENLSFEMRQEVVDCYFRLKKLLKLWKGINESN